jgi:hypothetical protein
MGERDKIEPAGPQDDAAKRAQEKRHEQRQKDIDQNQRDDPEDQR